MINLLPSDVKHDYTYAKRNSVLLKWIIGAIVALVGVILIIVGGLLVINQSANNYRKQVDLANQKLTAGNIEQTKKQVDDISNNTKLTLQVLSREVLFSKLIRQLGASLPENTQLQSLQVDKLQGGLTLTAAATDINAATQLQVNLQDPKNKIFEKADIENINCAGEGANVRFPCSVQIRALFLKNNPYLYITPKSGSSTEKKQ